MDKTTIPHRTLFASKTLALAALISACDPAASPLEEQTAVRQIALDNACTADPSRSVSDQKKGPRYVSTFFPNGIDLFHVNVVGGNCELPLSSPGYDSACCESNKGNASYTSCKQQQEQAVDEFLANLRARTPLLPPFRAKNVAPWQGHYYNDDEPHAGAIDFGKISLSSGEDPGFELFAAADGVVVWADWLSESAGNLIMLRHESPDGSWYLTEHRHVRGGSSRDKRKACSCIDPAAATSDARLAGCSTPQKALAICKYAANPAHDALWGTDATSLPTVGSTVSRGQRFGMAGNTGTVALDADGNPKSTNGNTHLHYMIWVPRPDGAQDGVGGADVMAVDPLGVYSKTSGSVDGLGCYDLAAPSTYERLLAPFLPEFVETPYSILAGNGHTNYYPNAGWGPQSINLYNAGGQILATGVYDPSVQSSGWKLWLNLSKSFMEDKVAAYPTRKVRQMSVRLSGGAPRYTAIWEAEAPGEQSEVYLDRSVDELNQLWDQKVVHGSFGVLDHFVHVVGGVERHNISFATSVAPNFIFHPSKTAAEAYSLQSSWLLTGNKPFAVSATEGNGGSAVRFSLLFRPMSGSSVYKLDMSAQTFAAEIATRKAGGWRLIRSQGYDNGTKFLGLWQKP